MTIQERRVKRGYTQGKVAGLLQIQRKHYQMIEAGRTVPSAVLAIRLARVFGCRVEDLFADRVQAA